MFSVYWMNKNHRDWTDDFIFVTKQEAVDYLSNQGYALNSGWYRRSAIGWEGDTKALICKMKIFGVDS